MCCACLSAFFSFCWLRAEGRDTYSALLLNAFLLGLRELCGFSYFICIGGLGTFFSMAVFLRLEWATRRTFISYLPLFDRLINAPRDCSRRFCCWEKCSLFMVVTPATCRDVNRLHYADSNLHMNDCFWKAAIMRSTVCLLTKRKSEPQEIITDLFSKILSHSIANDYWFADWNTEHTCETLPSKFTIFKIIAD